ncbi:MAG: lysylphosphatidylglycerol synthase transmembrane domain-containing protein [Candidatus Saccharimonadales bacterium]
MPKQKSAAWHVPVRFYIYTLILGVVLYLFIPQLGRFRASVEVLSRANVADVMAAILLHIGAFLIAAAVYGLLALKPLHYWRTFLVEIASSFANRLLPAGIGGLGVHGLYLTHNKHSVAQATAVVSTNNMIGIVGHNVMLLGVLMFAPHDVVLFRYHFSIKTLALIILVVALVLLISQFFGLRQKIRSFVKNLVTSFRSYARRPRRLVLAVLGSMLLTILNTAILYTSARAVGVELSAVAIFIVFSSGVLLGTATPTPGGLVGVEAGLYGAFLAYHVGPVPALAAVLLYRLITYWLPLVFGSIAFVVARRVKYV